MNHLSSKLCAVYELCSTYEVIVGYYVSFRKGQGDQAAEIEASEIPMFQRKSLVSPITQQ